MADSRGGKSQTVKENSGVKVLQADFDGTTSDTFLIDGDMPIVGLLIELSDAATITVKVVEGADEFDLYGADRTTVLTLGDGTSTKIAAFIPELAPYTKFKLVASATQTNAVISAQLTS